MSRPGSDDQMPKYWRLGIFIDEFLLSISEACCCETNQTSSLTVLDGLYHLTQFSVALNPE